jgi:DUF4097 and DUF4098 domain-containing protein YvlB
MDRKEFFRKLKQEPKIQKKYNIEEVIFYYEELIQDAVDNGEIELTNIESFNNIDGRNSNGSIFLDGVIGKNLDFVTSNGKITTSNISFDNLKLITSNGEIEASVLGIKSEYKIRISTSLGSRYIDGEKVDQSIFNTNQENYITIQSSNSSVRLNFDN